MQNRKLFSLVFAMVTGIGTAALPGCGDGSKSDACTTLCERVNKECGKSDDCSQTCNLFETTSTATGCAAALDTYLGCGNGASSVCAPMDECAAKKEAYFGCVETFCKASPDSAACKH
jgi:hypothetical protein